MGHENAFGFDLSDDTARATLPPRGAPYWQVTEYCRAIGFQHYPSGRCFWLGRVRRKDGSYRQYRLGPVKTDRNEIGMSFPEALQMAQEWFSEVRIRLATSDSFPIGSKEELNICPIGPIFTLGHALHDYIEWKRLAAARSHFLTLISLVNHHLVPTLASIPAHQFNGDLVRNFVRDVLETPPRYSRSKSAPKRPISNMTDEELRKRKKTVNTLLSILRVAVLMAWENGKIESERAWRCIRRLPLIERPRILHLNRDECRKLIDHCDPSLRQLVLGGLYTGCRITELIRMRVCDVGRDGPGVFVTPVKCYRERFVFLPNEGLSFFQNLTVGKLSDDLIFLKANGRPWYRCDYKYVFKKAVIAAGLSHAFCFHGLRHTYASQLVAAGTPLLVISEQLGHRNAATVIRTYGHMAPQARLSEVRSRFEALT
ncbi:tyrosine-type recombinase/integrase [Phyllobacterium sp. 22229]|uniref:tyrosine-type recombinase/integrase n=1 Tax=Phyllobacterium sp. 22229 TaxID=3453895 RepID=UPI003F82ED61